jgi:ATP-dependent protease HslVU (ClpYQ) peptidase subunit
MRATFDSVGDRGIALAADSALTLGNGKKIYHTAEKLFSLSPSIPVAIMTFGAADMMNVPWETVVKIYARHVASCATPTSSAGHAGATANFKLLSSTWTTPRG